MSSQEPQPFQHGIDLFNKGSYFECHEVLEDVWRNQHGDEKQFTQGLIQAAVAIHHLQRNNQNGARKLLERALARLNKFSPRYKDVNVAALVAELDRLRVSMDASVKPVIRAAVGD